MEAQKRRLHCLIIVGLCLLGVWMGVMAVPTDAEELQKSEIYSSKMDTTTTVEYPDSYEHAQKVESQGNSLLLQSINPAVEKTYQSLLNWNGEDSITVDLSGMNVLVPNDTNTTNELNVINVVSQAFQQDLIVNYAFGSYTYEYYLTGTTVVKIVITPSITKEAYDTRYNALYDAVQQAAACMIDSMSNQEKVLALHDYLALHAGYDYENTLAGTVPNDSFSPYGLLVNHVGVCNAYTETVDMLLSMEGIPSMKVISESMNHDWNMVKLDGNWYHMDVTWDDPVIKDSGTGEIADKPGFVLYNNFLQTDEGIKTASGSDSESMHIGWTSDVISTAATYANVPRGSNATQSYYYPGNCWYVCGTAAPAYPIKQYDFYGNALSAVYNTGNRVRGIQCVGNYEYYALNDQIVRWNPISDNRQVVYTLNGSERSGDGIIRALYALDSKRLYYTYLDSASVKQAGEYAIPHEVASIDVQNSPTKTEYITGQAFDVTGGKIEVIYDDGTKETIDLTEGMCAGFDTSKAGNQTITVTYDGRTTSFNITVVARVVTALKVITLPIKTSYTIGDTLELIGGTLEVTWNDGGTETKNITDEGVAVTGYNSSQEGSQTITVAYGGQTTTFIITVTKKVDTFELGDINADKAINASDALQALRYSVREITLKNDEFTRGDVTKDKEINASDALQILRYSVKEIKQF